MKVLVTGAAGFIGSYTVKALIAQGCEVVGLDIINSYYDVQLKYDRLADTGIAKELIEDGVLLPSSKYPSYRFIKIDLTDRDGLNHLFESEHFDVVVNLAAQAGVRCVHRIECCRFPEFAGVLPSLPGEPSGICQLKQYLWPE